MINHILFKNQKNSVLSEENTSTQTLETIANAFHQLFLKSDFFKIGCALVSCLELTNPGYMNRYILKCIIGHNPSKQRPHCSSDPAHRVRLFPLRHVPHRCNYLKSVRFRSDKSSGINKKKFRFFGSQKKNYNSNKSIKSPSSISNSGASKEYHWSMPRLTPQEKYFVGQLLTSPSKEVYMHIKQ